MSVIPIHKPTTEMHDENACNRRLARVIDQRDQAKKQLRELQSYTDDLNDAIIIVDNKRVSLWSIYESGDHFLRCKACAEVECEGCERG